MHCYKSSIGNICPFALRISLPSLAETQSILPMYPAVDVLGLIAVAFYLLPPIPHPAFNEDMEKHSAYVLVKLTPLLHEFLHLAPLFQRKSPHIISVHLPIRNPH